MILETTHETKDGIVQVVDFMPLREQHSHVIRVVKGLRGEVAMRGELALRFCYGEAAPWVTRTENGHSGRGRARFRYTWTPRHLLQ